MPAALPKLVLLAALLPAAAASAPAAAGPVLEIRLDGTPSVFVDAGGRVSACGLRVFGIEELPAPSERLRTVDISILFGAETVARDIGLVKAGSMEASAAALAGRQPMRPLAVTEGWLRAGGVRTEPLPLPAPADGDDPSALRYLADARALLAVVNAALAGEPIEASVVRTGQAVHPVYRGRLAMDGAARQRLAGCLDALQAGAGR